MSIRYLRIPITPELNGRETGWVMRNIMHLSGTMLRRVKWLDDGILLDGHRVTVREPVRCGQTLSVRLTAPERSSATELADGPLDIVYEDEDLVVVNKEAGVLVHPSYGHELDTVGNFLLAHYARFGDESDFHPIHRLDKGTSGLLVVAKNPHVQETLQQALHTGAFRRCYLAICDGVPDPPCGLISAPIGLADGSFVSHCVRPDGLPSRTRYRVLGAFPASDATKVPSEDDPASVDAPPPGLTPSISGPETSDFSSWPLLQEPAHSISDHMRSLVRLELETGRTHQIRVHMSWRGCPLTGDSLYGRENTALISRPALHSAHLELIHPISGLALTLDAPLPADMLKLLPPGTPAPAF